MTLHCCRLVRLFCCLLALAVAAPATFAADPAKTIVNDTLYRADGLPASGKLLISWPAFVTGDGKPVAAGNMSVTIGAGGAINLPLVPTQGATPTGSYYKVVLKLDDGASSTEYWSVPSLSPTTIAAIRSSVVPASVAMQVVSREYVDMADAGSVHKTGDETIAGAKNFSVSPLVPTPGVAQAAANKDYVDAAVGASGTGNLDSTYARLDGAYGFTAAIQTLGITDSGVGYNGVIGGTTPAAGTFSELISKTSPVLDVRAYGAACNGSTDDTAAIQAALTAAAARANGRTILIPGRCKVVVPSGGVAFQIDDTDIRFVGIGSSRVLSDGGGSGFDVYGGPGSLFQLYHDTQSGNLYSHIYEGTAAGFTLEHLYIHCADTANLAYLDRDNTMSYCSGLTAVKDWRSGSIFMDDVWFEQFEYAFWGVASDWNIWNNVRATYNKTAYYVGPWSESFAGNSVNAGYTNDVAFELEQPSHFVCNSCNVGFSGGGGHDPVYIHDENPDANTGGTDVVFNNPWLEFGAFSAPAGPPTAFFQIGKSDGTSLPISAVKILNPRIINSPHGAATQVVSLVESYGNHTISVTGDSKMAVASDWNSFDYILTSHSGNPTLDFHTNFSYASTAYVDLVNNISGTAQENIQYGVANKGTQTAENEHYFWWPKDLPTRVTIKAGKTASQQAAIQFKDYNDVLKWSIYKADAANGNYFFINDASKIRLRIDADHLRAYLGSALGKFMVYESTGATGVASIDNTGKGVFNGGVATTKLEQGGTLLTADASCAAGDYWIAPITGTTNKWRKCENSATSDLGYDLRVNAAAAAGANLSDTDPAAPANAINIKWQLNSATNPDNLSAHLAYAAPLTVSTGNLTVSTGTTVGTVAAGNDPRIANASGSGACTNQFVRVANAGAAPGCASVGAADISEAAVTTSKVSPALRTRSVSFTFENPGTSDVVLVFDPGQNVTITRLQCAVKAATSAAIRLYKTSEADLYNTGAGTAVHASDLTCSAGGGNTSSFTSAAVPTHTPVMLKVNAVSGSPGWLAGTLEYTLDAAQ